MDIVIFIVLPIFVVLYSAFRIKQSGSRNLITGIGAVCTLALFLVSGVSVAGFASKGAALEMWKQHSQESSISSTSLIFALISLLFFLTCVATGLVCIVRRTSGWRAAFALQAVVFLIDFLFFLQLTMET
jgi:hypothetical protein